MLARVISTIVVILGYGWVNYLLNPIATLGAGKVAREQFDFNDMSYIHSQFGMDFFGHLGVPFLALLLILALIWFKPAKKWVKTGVKGLTASALLVAFATAPTPSKAYYDKTDYTEAFFILPNESAFYVPDVGDNKSSQAKFGSEQYYQENKIAAKRFVIPHVKLEGSGLWSNFYVPAGRLFVLNRSPVSLEWVADPKRGSSPANEAFPCQSKEGLNITVGMAIGVSVSDDNAAKYLAHFGVAPLKGDRSTPEVTFTSIMQARPLFDVMTTVGRNKVQALVCNELTSRSFDDGNSQALVVMQSVKDAASKYFDGVGITLEYLGWADTMTFDPDVQAAVNLRYTNEHLRPVLDVMMTKAEIDTMQKWNGVIPNFSGLWILPHDVLSAFTSWLGSSTAQGAIGATKK